MAQLKANAERYNGYAANRLAHAHVMGLMGNKRVRWGGLYKRRCGAKTRRGTKSAVRAHAHAMLLRRFDSGLYGFPELFTFSVFCQMCHIR